MSVEFDGDETALGRTRVCTTSVDPFSLGTPPRVRMICSYFFLLADCRYSHAICWRHYIRRATATAAAMHAHITFYDCLHGACVTMETWSYSYSRLVAFSASLRLH
jgi:hypothetical protein